MNPARVALAVADDPSVILTWDLLLQRRAPECWYTSSAVCPLECPRSDRQGHTHSRYLKAFVVVVP